MKRLSFAFIIALAAILSSCTGAPGLDGRDGRDGKDGLGVINSVLINVKQSDWMYSDQPNNNYFYATVTMPEITEKAFKMGMIKMYRSYDFGTTNATQIEMPYVRLNERNVGGNEWVFYTETVDYQFNVGSLTIYYTASDFDYEIDETFVPEAMQFRCVIMY